MPYQLHPAARVNTSATLKNLSDLVLSSKRPVIIETYPGVRQDAVIKHLRASGFTGPITLSQSYATHDQTSFRAAIASDLTEDRVFGKLTSQNYADFFDKAAAQKLKKSLTAPHVVIGVGAYLAAPDTAIIIYADLPRYTIQQRFRQGAAVYFAGGKESDNLSNFKRGYFVEWRMADRIKMRLWSRVHYFLVSDEATTLTLINASSVRRATRLLSRQPFRMEPYFDAGLWGGTWMQEHFNLPPLSAGQNYAWGFDGVPEENSVRLVFDNDVTYQMPALNVVLFAPRSLLGNHVYKRFGAEFPIRFDLLDTINGQNLSLQVHPNGSYIKTHFNMSYTQEESYYILDVAPESAPGVYLGLKNHVNLTQFGNALIAAQQTNELPVTNYVNFFALKAHDHVLHPAGCIHAAARGCMVLEISATPYIFTFKLWDWARVDFDGQPRPINISRGLANIDLHFDTKRVELECLAAPQIVAQTQHVLVEHTGLHKRQFIETRRYTLGPQQSYDLTTNDSVNMLNLVRGQQISVESIGESALRPLIINYAETFIVPASCKKYRISNLTDQPISVLQAYVR